MTPERRVTEYATRAAEFEVDLQRRRRRPDWGSIVVVTLCVTFWLCAATLVLLEVTS